MNVTLAVDVGDEERVLLVPRHNGEYAKVGTVAAVGDAVRLPGGARAVSLNGLHRGIAGAAHTGPDGRISAFVRSIRETGALADTAAYAPDLGFDDKIELLEAIDVVERLELALRLQR